MNILGMPRYLWSIDNARTIAVEVGVGLVELDWECLEFRNMESLRIKVWGVALRNGRGNMNVTNHLRDYGL